jgi:hypothetical protein
MPVTPSDIAQSVRPEPVPGLPVQPVQPVPSTTLRPDSVQVRLLPASPTAACQPPAPPAATGGPTS